MRQPVGGRGEGWLWRGHRSVPVCLFFPDSGNVTAALVVTQHLNYGTGGGNQSFGAAQQLQTCCPGHNYGLGNTKGKRTSVIFNQLEHFTTS